MESPLKDRNILIQGSAHESTGQKLLEHSHALIHHLAIGLSKRGARLVVRASTEEYVVDSDPRTSKWYDWTVLSGIAEIDSDQPMAIAFETEKDETPTIRQNLWQNLRDKNRVQVTHTTHNAGAFLRRKMVRISDAMVSLGGGEGVEDCAELMIEMGRPVIPLGLPISPAFKDGIGGSERLAKLMKSNPSQFLGSDTASLLSAHQRGSDPSNSPKDAADEIIKMLEEVVRPQAFIIRLMNKEHCDYQDVQRFIEDTVKPALNQKNYRVSESGVSQSENFFLNVDIFKQIQKSSVVVSDLTGSRIDCYLELGYALGLEIPVLITAKKDTKIGFDTSSAETYFWQPSDRDVERIKKIHHHLQRALSRPSLRSPVSLVS